MRTVTTAILIKNDAFDTQSIMEYYLAPLEGMGIFRDQVTVRPLIYNTPKKITAKTGKAYLDKLLPDLPDSIENLIVADSNYYKWIMKTNKVSSLHGVVANGKYPGTEKYNCVFVPNYKSLFKQPENIDLINTGLKVLTGNTNKFSPKTEIYVTKYGEDRELLDSLYKYSALTIDIESYGLAYDAEVATISFAWDTHNGCAIDLRETGYHYTKLFLEQYQGQIIMHNALFDAKLMIRNWWMNSETDYVGMQEGLKVFERVDDSMLTAFLAKNATTQVALGLKECALEYVGNYALDITNIALHSQKELLRYNLVDTLATWYVWDKFSSEADTEPYREIFQPSIKPILKMMLVGLPMDQHKVDHAYTDLKTKEVVLRKRIAANPYIVTYNQALQIDACDFANSKLKKLKKTVDDFQDVEFNPNSGPQLSKLLYEVFKLPVLDKTKNGNPSTDAKTLKSLKNHTNDPDIVEIIECVLDLTDVTKISGTFLKAFKAGGNFLHGNLKLGGTQSGRLSSNSPNLTNLPSHGPMGKLIKSCVVAPEGETLLDQKQISDIICSYK